MYRKRKIPLHAARHYEAGVDELNLPLDSLAPRMGKGALPAASAAYEDSIWLADDGKLYHCDGSAWTPFSGGGAKPTPTVLVAASNAITTTGADYICDGTADEVQINLAIVDVATTGGVVQLTEGTFTLAGSIVIDSSVTLRGCGKATQIQWALGVAATTDMIPATGENDVVLEDLWLDGSRYSSGEYRMLDLVTCNDWLIQRCVFTSCSEAALLMDNCSHIVIVRNRFYNNVRTIRTVATTGACSKLCIDGNYLYGGSSPAAIDMVGTDYSYIGGNIIDALVTDEHAVSLNTSDFTSVCHNVLTLNDSSSNGYGVYNYRSDQSLIRGNSIYGGRPKIGLRGPAGFGTIVSANVGRKDQFFYCNYDMNYNVIVGNVNRGWAVGNGFDIRDTLDTLLAYNLIYTSALHNMVLQGGAGTGNGVDDASVIGNRLMSAGGTYEGIGVNSGSTLNLLIGNNINGAASGYGIDLDAGANNGQCQFNHVRGNTLGWRDNATGTMKGASAVNNNDLA